MSIRIAPKAEVFPGYFLIERLGRGGFGEVWKAEAPGGMLKAIKFVYGNIDDATEDGRPAEQELKALHRVKSIRHPFILSLERFEVIEGQLCILMELAERNLYDRYRECQRDGLPGIPREELLGYMFEAAEALDLMNTHYQLQHLDIKPQNLFLMFNHVKVADFGLAKDMEGKQATLTGGVTPVYAAPETFNFQVSRFCDQYSLAIVFQEMLTGHRPFNGATAKQLMMQHIQSAPDLSSLETADQAIVRRALSKAPDDRYPMCADFVRALREARSPKAAAGLVYQVPVLGSTGVSPIPGTEVIADGGPLVGMNQIPGDLPVLKEIGKLPGLPTPAPMRIASTAPTKVGKAEVPEQVGDGVLFPVVIVGIGQMGLLLLQRLRRAIRGQFGTPMLPHLRYCYIDTDPATLQAAESGSTNSPTAREMVLARLNRPSHYNRPGSGQLAVDGWLNPQLLFRIPRNPSVSGVRAFGRLAFHDHYKTIIQRLRADLEAVVAPESLAEADKFTSLGLRTNRPRVYVVAGLTGGTGGGMFIDLAYAVRHQMKLMGYSQPDIHGVFLVPPVDRNTPKTPAVANAYAALLELAHYSASNTAYQAKFDMKEGTIVDRDRPFQRCMILQMPKSMEGTDLKPIIGLATGCLFREMLTTFGRSADKVRTEITSLADRSTPFYTVGTFRLAWPRAVLLERSARRCSERMLDWWTKQDTTALAPHIVAVVDGDWVRHHLNPEAILDRLRDSANGGLTAKSDPLYDSLMNVAEEVNTKTELTKDEVAKRIDEVIRFVGQPIVAGQLTTRGVLNVVIESVVQEVTKDAVSQVTEIANAFLEQPGYRLSAAEVAIEHLTLRIRATLEQLEPRLVGPRKEALSSYNRIIAHAEALDAANWSIRRNSITREILTEFRIFALTQFESLLLQGLCGVYQGVVGTLAEYVRDVQFCRQRLEGVRGRFATSYAAAELEAYLGPGKPILPDGCRNVEQAAIQVSENLNYEELLEFDTMIQNQVRKQFKSLLTCCLDKNDQTKALAEVVMDQSLAFLEPRFREVNTAAVFFQDRTQEQAAYRDVMHAYDEAAPELNAKPANADRQICLLSVSDDPDGMRFARIAERTITDAPLMMVTGSDAIIFHREQVLTPSDLPQLGAFAKEAFTQVTQLEQISPHTRNDVNWLPVESLK